MADFMARRGVVHPHGGVQDGEGGGGNQALPPLCWRNICRYNKSGYVRLVLQFKNAQVEFLGVPDSDP
jgi:hypothetical protein